MSELTAPQLYTSDSTEWYTPHDILVRVVKTMGAIDLDPCSNRGIPNVPAFKHYTEDDDGLVQAWGGRVYMNPPYGTELKRWIAKLVEEFNAGRVNEAIALVPSRTDTKWFRSLAPHPKCFIWGRLKFSGQKNSAPFPSMAVYMGTNTYSFLENFKEIGDIYVRVA